MFSITFAASATFIDSELYIFLVTYLLKKFDNNFVVLLFEPETILVILWSLCFGSPTLILSGEYPQKKSLLNFSFDIFSIIGTHISSVQPGNTVDSYTTIESFFINDAIILVASIINFKSGLFLLSTGVGTVTTKRSEFFILFLSLVKIKFFFPLLISMEECSL